MYPYQRAWAFLHATGALLLLTSYGTCILQQRYSKVAGSSLPVIASKWHLANHTISLPLYPPKLECGLECKIVTNCRAFCISEDARSCALYSINLVKRFQVEPDATNFNYSACYSSWAEPTDVILPTMEVACGSVWSGGSNFGPSTALQGIYDPGTLTHCYVSSSTTNQFWQVNLGQKIKIKALILATYRSSHFENVDIRFGNSTDRLANPVWGSFTGPAPSNDTFTITGASYMSGQYLSVNKLDSGYIIICSIQIRR